MNFINDDLRGLLDRANWEGLEVEDVEREIEVWSRVHREAVRWNWTSTIQDAEQARGQMIRVLCERVYG